MQTTPIQSTARSQAAKVALALGAVLLASCSASTIQASSPGRMQVYRSGTIKPVQGPDDWFTGSVRIDNLFAPPAPSRAASSLVSFERGARTHWHEHPLGQTLIIRSGVGWTQAAGGPIIEVHPGDVVWCPPHVRHWHGATSTSAMSHIAVWEALDGKAVTWGDPVTDAEYLKGATASEGTTATPRTTSASDPDVAFVSPVLARYLRESVDGNLWQRPQLSARDRSLVMLSVMIARGQSADLALQIGRALDNGVKPREISESLTHLGFYAGLANARGAARLSPQQGDGQRPHCRTGGRGDRADCFLCRLAPSVRLGRRSG